MTNPGSSHYEELMKRIHAVEAQADWLEKELMTRLELVEKKLEALEDDQRDPLSDTETK